MCASMHACVCVSGLVSEDGVCTVIACKQVWVWVVLVCACAQCCYMWTFKSKCMCVCVHAHANMHVHTCACMCVYAQTVYVCACMNVCVCVCVVYSVWIYLCVCSVIQGFCMHSYFRSVICYFTWLCCQEVAWPSIGSDRLDNATVTAATPQENNLNFF